MGHEEHPRQGRLPAGKPVRVLGGSGSGLPCDLCARELVTTEPEIEMEFVSEDAFVPRRYHVHVRCFMLWEDRQAQEH